MPPKQTPKPTPETPLLSPELMTIEEVVQVVTIERQRALAAKALEGQVEVPAAGPVPGSPLGVPVPTPTDKPERKSPLKGGAFGGALKRRIEETDSTAKLAATNETDINLLQPEVIKNELFAVPGDYTYGFPASRKNERNWVLMTPSEYKSLTLSPTKLAGRVGANVLANTEEREPTVQHAREVEVQHDTLKKRLEIASSQLSSLGVDDEVFNVLLKEMRSPGYAHMTQDEMDAHMAHAEGVFVEMFKAIVKNHKAPTERVKSLTAALDYRLSSDDYKKTFDYWKDMSKLGQRWTRLKITAFTNVQKKLVEEYENRFGQTPTLY